MFRNEFCEPLFCEDFENFFGDVAVLMAWDDTENPLVSVVFDYDMYVNFTDNYDSALDRLYKLGFRA